MPEQGVQGGGSCAVLPRQAHVWLLSPTRGRGHPGSGPLCFLPVVSARCPGFRAATDSALSASAQGWADFRLLASERPGVSHELLRAGKRRQGLSKTPPRAADHAEVRSGELLLRARSCSTWRLCELSAPCLGWFIPGPISQVRKRRWGHDSVTGAFKARRWNPGRLPRLLPFPYFLQQESCPHSQ